MDAAFRYVDSNGRNEGQKVIWNINKLTNGTNTTVWVTVKLLTNGTLSNVAHVNCSENTTDVPSTSSNVTVKPVVDLTIFKNVSCTNACVGDLITYWVLVKNNGPSTATGVIVNENIRGSFKFIKINPSKGRYDENSNVWEVGSLRANESAVLQLTVYLTSSGTLENSVVAESNENDTDNSNNNYTSDNVTVNKLTTPIKITVENITYGEDETITVTLPGPVTGHVNITVGEVQYNNRPIRNGVVELQVSNLDSGKYNVTAVYSGDGKYHANSTNATFTVSKVTPQIRIETVDIWYGEVEVLNVTVNAPGYVNITVANTTVTLSLDNGVYSGGLLMAFNPLSYDGKATWNILNLPVGNYNASALYIGDRNYESVKITDTFRVKALPSSVNVTADDIYVGETAVIKVSVTPNATGNVTISIDGEEHTVNITNGTAKLRVADLKAGVKEVRVRYNGDEVYLASENTTTFTVKKIKPPIDVVSNDIHVGDDEKITVKLPGDATGNVTITVNGKKYTARVENGVCEFTVQGLKAGVDAEYSGDDKYLPTAGEDTFKVSKLKPDILIDAPDIAIGEDGVITVELPDDATGTVTIEIDGKRYTAEVKDGKAVFHIPGLKIGKYDIWAYYSGDDKYLPVDATGEMEVLGIYDEDDHVEKAHHVRSEMKATGNPIFMLLVVLMAGIGLAVRRYKK